MGNPLHVQRILRALTRADAKAPRPGLAAAATARDLPISRNQRMSDSRLCAF